MSENVLRVLGSEGLRLSDITVNNPRESYKFKDIRVDAIDVILSDRTIDPVSIQITAKCTLEASRTNDPLEGLGRRYQFPRLPETARELQWKSGTQPLCRHEVRPVVPTKGTDFGVTIPIEMAREVLSLAHEHNFQYKGVVDGKHRFECSCGAMREEELNGGHGSQQDPSGPDASDQ